MTEELTARQSQILGMLRLSVKERGYPPSVREIGTAVGLASSSVARQLHELEDKGHIVRDPNKPRALRIVEPGDNIEWGIQWDDHVDGLLDVVPCTSEQVAREKLAESAFDGQLVTRVVGPWTKAGL